MKHSSQYSLLKGALLDISPYVHAGIDIEDIEECLSEILSENGQSYAKPLSTVLAYHIQTNYENDCDVIKLMDKIVNELDIMMAKLKYPEAIKQIN